MYIERLPLRNIWLREDDSLGLQYSELCEHGLSILGTTYQKIAQFNGGVGA